MTYTHFGEMFELLPIYATALLLGLVSGLVAVHLVTTRMRLSLRALGGIVVLAALLSCLIAAKPASWRAIVEFWVLAAVVMAVIDLSGSFLVEPWRTTARFSERSLRRMRSWLAPGFLGVVAGTLAVLKLRFDIPLNTRLLPTFSAGLAIALLALAALDLAVRFAVIGLGCRWRMRHATGRSR